MASVQTTISIENYRFDGIYWFSKVELNRNIYEAASLKHVFVFLVLFLGKAKAEHFLYFS